MPTFHEFFAGAGMARAGLGAGWTCLFANDVDAKKAAAYRANWGDAEFKLGDVRDVTLADLPGRVDLAWGSFPCQDLSLAGVGAGLNGARSGTFFPFWAAIGALARDGRAPGLVVLENVCGALTSHGGRDFAAIDGAFANAGYRLGALVIDAADFVPQSRPRLFMLGVRANLPIDPKLASPAPNEPFHTPALVAAVQRLPAERREEFVWWRPPPPPLRRTSLADLIEDEPTGVSWHAASQTARLLNLLSPLHRAKLDASRRAGRRVAGTLYRRTRTDSQGRKAQRAEIRFDGLAGCLRTPAGGSSRQTLLLVEGERVRSRLLSPRETARLMGLPDTYRLPARANEAYHLAGDGVVVPVVAHLARSLLEPLIAGASAARRHAA